MTATAVRPRVFSANEVSLALVCGLCAHLPILIAQCSVGWNPPDYAMVDEFGFSRAALDLARTGHLDLLGWASITIFGLLYWAQPFVALFGPTYLSTRLSAWTLDLLGPAAVFLILRQRGASKSVSALGALTLGWSPLYTLAAAPFMTDAPYLALCLVGVFCFERALLDPGSFSRRWFSAGALAFVAAGTIRQTAVMGLVAALGAAGRSRLRTSAVPILASAGLVIALSYGLARATPGFLPLGDPLPLTPSRLLEWPSLALVLAMGLAPLVLGLRFRARWSAGFAFFVLCAVWALAARADPGRPPGFMGTAFGPGVSDPFSSLPLVGLGLLVLSLLPAILRSGPVFRPGVLEIFAVLQGLSLIPLFASRPLFDRYGLPMAAALTVAIAAQPALHRVRAAAVLVGVGLLSTLLLEGTLHDKTLQWELGRGAVARGIPADAVAIDFTWAGFHARPGSLWDATQNPPPRRYRVTARLEAGEVSLDRRDRARWWRPGARGAYRYFYLVDRDAARTGEP